MFSRNLRLIQSLIRNSRCAFSINSKKVPIHKIKEERREEAYSLALSVKDPEMMIDIQDKIDYSFNKGFAILHNCYCTDETHEGFYYLTYAKELFDQHLCRLDKNKLTEYIKCIECFERQYNRVNSGQHIDYEDLEFVEIN